MTETLRLLRARAALALLLTFGLAAPALLQAQERAGEAPRKPAPAFYHAQAERTLAEAPALLRQLTDADAETGFRVSATETDELGMTHVRYAQTYRGLPVDGYGYTAHARGGQLVTVTGAFAKTEGLDVTPTLAPARGLDAALRQLDLRAPLWDSPDAPADYAKPAGELVVFHDARAKQSHLAYKYDVYAAEPLYRAWVYVDAHSGEVLFENLRIHHADQPVSAVSDYNGTVQITADLSGGTYRLRQAAQGGGVETYSLNNGTRYSSATDVTDNGTPFNSDGTAVQAHYGAERTYDYFFSKHGRNSYNGTGGKLLSYVHYSSNYVNAFWDGSRMTYGDGDGVNYGPLTSLDIAGHEMAHGVTEYAAGLIYSYESGALNESFSDIFGEMVEFHATGTNDWQMGTDIGIGGSGAIRSMNNPNAYNDPDTYGGSYYYTGSGDNGGVHINSGVQNKWFYILAVGESGTNDLGDAYSVTGIGRTAAAAIAYRNLTVYLSASSNYAAARAGAIQAAVDLYGAGSPEEVATTDAWHAVGVGQPYGGGGGGGGGSCVDGAVTLTLTTDNYASETSWTLKDGSGATVASGSGYQNNQTYTVNWTLADDTYVFTINDSYGDGICCGYGQGSYALASGGTTIVSGGNFGGSETTTFCVTNSGGPGPDTQAPTVPGSLAAGTETETTVDLTWAASTDNAGVDGYYVYVDGQQLGSVTGTSATVNGLTAGTTYSFGVSAFDAAGNESAQATTSATTTGGGGGGGGTQVLLASYFETGWDGWLDGGSDCYRYSGSRSYEGSRSIRLRDNSGVASSMTTAQGYDLTGAASVDVEFYFYPYSMENGEDFWVQYDAGSGWQTVAAYARGTHFNNNTFYTATVTLAAADYTFSSNGRFRFRCDASANADHVYIDQVTITRNGGSAFVGAPLASSQTISPVAAPNAWAGEPDPADIGADAEEPDALSLALAPNPARDHLDLRVSDPAAVAEVRLVSATGQRARVLTREEYTDRIDVRREAPGLYLLMVRTTDGETRALRFVKE